MQLKVYISDACGNSRMRRQQSYICRILDIKGIPYSWVDVADPQQYKEKLFMQNKLKINDHDLKALPPQIFFGEEYRGAFDDFFTAVECEELFSYLKMDVPETEVEYDRRVQQSGGVVGRTAAPTVSVHAPPAESGHIGEKEKHSVESKERDERGGDAVAAEEPECSGNESSSADDNSEDGHTDDECAIEEERTPEEREEQPAEKGDQVKAEEDEHTSSGEDSSSSEESSSEEESTDEDEKKDIKEPTEKGGNQVKAEQVDSSSGEDSSSSDETSSSGSSSGEEE